MKNLKEFKEEFRSICCDTWGDALDAWFEAAGQLNKRNFPLPMEWKYKPGLLGGTDEECRWYEDFENADTDLLNQIGNFLFRYCQMLKHFGKDY